MTRAGRASKKLFFGEHNRYAIAAVHTRFSAVQWFVWDAEAADEDGRATVLRQEDTIAAALGPAGRREVRNKFYLKMVAGDGMEELKDSESKA